MEQTGIIETDRLILRQWKDSDRKPFAELNSDAEVMKHFPNILDESGSKQLVERLKAHIDEKGWGFWAVELKDTKDFIGLVGINSPSDNLPFIPSIEVGWRLSRKFWGRGYATEAAKASLKFAFENLAADEIVSFTTVQNKPSQSVMKRIGMVNVQENFQHPSVAVGSRHREHVLFKITKEEWLNGS